MLPDPRAARHSPRCGPQVPRSPRAPAVSARRSASRARRARRRPGQSELGGPGPRRWFPHTAVAAAPGAQGGFCPPRARAREFTPQFPLSGGTPGAGTGWLRRGAGRRAPGLQGPGTGVADRVGGATRFLCARLSGPEHPLVSSGLGGLPARPHAAGVRNLRASVGICKVRRQVPISWLK